MRIDLQSGLPVVVSDDSTSHPIYQATSGVPQTNPAREASAFRRALKRLKAQPSWGAERNPFLERETFIDWYFDHIDAPYMSTQSLHELVAARIDGLAYEQHLNQMAEYYESASR